MYERHIVLPPPSGQGQGVLQTKSSLLRCADKHKRIEIQNQKTKGQKARAKTLRASHLFTVCDTSALAFLLSCLLRCANKHSVIALKTKDKTLKAMCLLHCAHKHKRIEFKSSKPKSKRQNPVGTKYRGKKQV